MANGQRDVGKQALWREVLARHGASGLSVAEFCRREGLSQPSFYAWRRTLAERDRQPGKPTTRRRPVREFLPLRVIDPPGRASSITIELAGGRLLRLPESISPQRLAELVQALEALAVQAQALVAKAPR